MKSPVSFSLEDEGEVKSIGELKDEFYVTVTFTRRELNKLGRKKPRLAAMKPQALVFNPLGYGDVDSATHSDVYVAVYYRGYHVRIQQGESIFGPHKFELYYQVKPGLRVWLGMWATKCNFFKAKEIKKKLRDAILREHYFCSEKSAADIVEFPTNEPDIAI